LGADVGYLDAYQGHGSVAVPQGILCSWITLTHGGILVNTHGERFGDEMEGYSSFARRVLAQPEGVAYVIIDRRIDGMCRPFSDYQSLVDTGAPQWAADANELARAIGAPPDRLRETLHAALGCAGGAQSDQFGRTDWEAPLEPEFGYIKVTGALFHTQGGLLVDGNARVLKSGRPIPGLYAAGGSAAGISGVGADGYLAGNGLLGALGLGYLAGRDLAAPDTP
jgi:fumarate reductase flavoprotein subunit